MATYNTRNGRWVSAETETKERHLRGLLGMHANICKGLLQRHNAPPYLYVDLHAGRGHLEFEGRQFDGSPLIAREILTQAGIRHETVHYEKDPVEAAFLIEAMTGRSSTLFDFGEVPDYPVCIEPFEVGFSRWLDEHGPQPYRYGLVYSDPIHGPIPVEMFNKAAHLMPRVDVLSYVAATQYKRQRGSDPSRPFLAGHIRAVDKRVSLIREPIGAWQWTFVLWSNWVNLPDWQRQGFYRLDSAQGERILDRLNLSTKEQHERTNTPLFQSSRPDDAPYRGYQEYLRHPRFKEIRAEVFKRASGICERCCERMPTERITYATRPGAPSTCPRT